MLANLGAGIAEASHQIPSIPTRYLPSKGGRCKEQDSPWADAAATPEIAWHGVTPGSAEGTSILPAQAESPAGPDQMGRHDRHLQHDHQENIKNPPQKREKSKMPVLQLKKNSSREPAEIADLCGSALTAPAFLYYPDHQLLTNQDMPDGVLM